jgi:hypothetical protein
VSWWGGPDVVPVDWDDLSARAGEIIAETERSVRRWVWAKDTARWERPEPFFSQRFGNDPVVRPARGTPDPTRSVRYGYLEDDAPPVIATRYTTYGREVVPDGRIVRLGDARAELIADFESFRQPAGSLLVVPDSVLELHRSGGRLEALTKHLHPRRVVTGWDRETYDYDDSGRVAAVRFESWSPEEDWEGRQHRGAVLDAEYDEAGELVLLTRCELDRDGEPTGEPAIAWRRIDRQAVRKAQEFLERELPAATLAWVQRQALVEPVYGLGILFDPDGSNWAPSLGLGTVAELHAWGGQGSEDRLTRMWNPAEFACFDAAPAEIDTPAFQEAFRTTSQAWRDKGTAKIRRICRDLAASLVDPARDALADAGDPFVAFAAEIDSDESDPSVRKTVPKPVRAALERL